MTITTADQLLDQLEGATIVSSHVDGDEGMHLVMQDGRVLIIAGVFALSVLRIERGKLH